MNNTYTLHEVKNTVGNFYIPEHDLEDMECVRSCTCWRDSEGDSIYLCRSCEHSLYIIENEMIYRREHEDTLPRFDDIVSPI